MRRYQRISKELKNRIVKDIAGRAGIFNVDEYLLADIKKMILEEKKSALIKAISRRAKKLGLLGTFLVANYSQPYISLAFVIPDILRNKINLLSNGQNQGIIRKLEKQYEGVDYELSLIHEGHEVDVLLSSGPFSDAEDLATYLSKMNAMLQNLCDEFCYQYEEKEIKVVVLD